MEDLKYYESNKREIERRSLAPRIRHPKARARHGTSGICGRIRRTRKPEQRQCGRKKILRPAHLADCCRRRSFSYPARRGSACSKEKEGREEIKEWTNS